MRINFEFTEEQVNELKAFQQKTGCTSMKDLFNNAMTLLEWAVDETTKGNQVASLNPETQNIRTILMPIMQQAAKQGKTANASQRSELVLT